MTIAVSRASTADATQAYRTLQVSGKKSTAAPEILAASLSDPDLMLLLATRVESPAGYLHAQIMYRLDGGRMMLVYDVQVAADHRRRAVATALMEAALAQAAGMSIEDVWLVTEPDNEAAISLYESIGGEPFPSLGFEWGHPSDASPD